MEYQLRRARLMTMAVLAVGLFALFCVFPLSGDDWFREGLGASLHSAGDLVRTVAEKWRTTNGRIFGNVLAYSAGSRPILREVLRAGITLALIALLARFSSLSTPAGLFLCAAAALALPRELLREVYPWAAGYFNYVPPAVCLLGALTLVSGAPDGRLRESAWRTAAVFALAFAAQLFIENATVCTLCAALLLNLCYLVRERRISSALAGFLLGALGGAALLFASPSYADIFAGGANYEASIFSGLAGLLDAARAHSAVVFRFLLADCPVLYLSVTAALARLFLLAKRSAADTLLLALLVLCTLALPLRGVLALTELKLAFTVLLWFALALLAVLRWAEGSARSRAALCLLLSLAAALPLLFVSPIGPRCLFLSYVLVLAAAGNLLACGGASLRSTRALVISALLALLVGGALVRIYLPLDRAVAAQQEMIEEAMARGETSVSVAACGGERWLWEPDTFKMESAYYYATPGDLTITFASSSAD